MHLNRISVAALAEEAIARGGNRLISIPSLVVDLRKAVPDCEHTDEELAQLIATIAISKGCNLSFLRPQAFPVG